MVSVKGPYVPYTEKLQTYIQQTVKNDIRWNYEVKKRKWKLVYRELFTLKMKNKYQQLAHIS